MNLLLDTNILIQLINGKNLQRLYETINPQNQRVYISIVSVGELKSIRLKNKWGDEKWEIANFILDGITVLEINETLADTYAEIDAFSQRRNPSYNSYSFATPRNMGKNDLWIASTAALLGLKLITTDADFDHLNSIFLEVERLKPDLFKG